MKKKKKKELTNSQFLTVCQEKFNWTHWIGKASAGWLLRQMWPQERNNILWVLNDQ